MQTIIGWIALIIFSIIIVVQFYLYYGVRRIFNRIIQENSDNTIIDEANDVKKKSTRARMKWLRNNKSILSGNVLSDANKILWADTLTFLLFGVLILLWATATLF
jgi:hypothetical protein